MALFLSLVGAALGGAVNGLGRPVSVVVAALGVLWAVRVATGAGLPFPSSTWQVPVTWRERFPAQVTMLLYGALLGVGFLTTVVFPVYWFFVGGTLLSGSVITNLLGWWAYAGVRSLSTWNGLRHRYQRGTGEEPPIVEAPHMFVARALSVFALVGVSLWVLLL
jgi:hypothetical protein